MKSVIAAVVLLILSVGLCLFFSSKTSARIHELYQMTEALPKTPNDYRQNTTKYLSAVEAAAEYWSDAVTYFSYVCGYAALNRADEAVWNLYAAVNAGDYAAAVSARYQLLDALRRMRELEGISLSSVF